MQKNRLYLLIGLILLSVVSFAQPTIINRSNGANTVNDPNLSASRSLIIPRYVDTGQANTQWPLIDSVGKIIYTRSDGKFWVRKASPSRWSEVGGGSGNTNSNVGAGYRWAIPNTNNIKTLLAGWGTLVDSATNTLTVRGDTSVIPTHHYIDSVKGTTGLTEGAQRSSVVIDQPYYDGFPTIAFDVTNPNIVATMWKSSGGHADAGIGLMSTSTDGFTNFTTPDTVKVGGVAISNTTLTIGKGNGTRWLVAWSKATDDTIHFAINDDASPDFTGQSFMLAPAGYDWIQPFGKVIKINGDTLYMPGYGLRTGQTLTDALWFKTYNNGVTWTYGGVMVLNSSISNSSPSEGDWVVVQGGTVATTKILCILRDDTILGYHNELTSSDGGATWVNHVVTEGAWAFGAVNASVTDKSWPALLIKIGENIYAIHTIRSFPAFGGFSMRVFKANALAAFNSVAAWDLDFTTPYRATDYYKGSGIDWGYSWPFPTPLGLVKVMFYDMSVAYSNRPTMDKRTAIKSIAVLGNNTYEAFNNSNQSISSGTETAVIFPDAWLDSENFYSSDSSKIYIPNDGHYYIHAKILLDTSSLGTYRLAKLLAIDWGTTYSITPQYANYEISKRIIQPSTNSDFCYLELSGTIYCWKGMEIRVTITHDKGSSLNIINSVVNEGTDGARIRIKRIN